MAKAATILKKPAPAAAAPVLKGKAPVAKTAPKINAPKAAKPAAAPKPAKPFVPGEIVIFKGYSQASEDAQFTPDMELAVVGQRDDNGATFVACVEVSKFHAYNTDPASVHGEEVTPAEIKRTSKHVEEAYELPTVGNMPALLKTHGGDILEIAKDLYGKAAESFFYLGGTLAQLWKGRDENGVPIFATYEREDGTMYPTTTEGFELFLQEQFGGDFGGASKAKKLIATYEAFSALADAGSIVKELPKIGWWKASLLSSFVTDENATELLETAAETTAKDLTEVLKTKYTTEGTTPQGKAATRVTIRKTTFGPFKLFEDQAAGVEYILKAAAKQTGVNDPNALFEHIITEWATDHLADTAQKAATKVESTRKALLKSGIKLPADHPAAKVAPVTA